MPQVISTQQLRNLSSHFFDTVGRVHFAFFAKTYQLRVLHSAAVVHAATLDAAALYGPPSRLPFTVIR